MNRKFLDGLLSFVEDENTKKDVINKIMDENGKQIESHKTEVETLKNDLKVKENLVDELNNKIKEKDSVDIEAIKQEEFEKGKAEGSKEVETFKQNIALEKALSGTKARDIKLLEKLLDKDKITYEEKDGNFEISGLDEQIKGFKESHAYLFEEEKKETPGIDLGGEHNGSTPKNEPTDLMGALHEKYDKK